MNLTVHNFVFTIAILLVYLLSEKCVDSYKILAVFPMAGKSINILYHHLLKGLTDAGHDVVVISAYENKLSITNGSYRDIILTGFAEDYEDMLEAHNLLETPESFPIWEVEHMSEMLFGILNQTFHHPNLIRFLKEDHKFDLFITEYFWIEPLFAFGWKYNCPIVLFTSMGGVNNYIHSLMGNPLSPSYVPHFFNVGDYSRGMTFSERAYNLLYFMYDQFYYYFSNYPNNNRLTKIAFPNAPRVEEMSKNISLVLVGSHSSLLQATPSTPNVVEIGGFHINPPKKLPKDIQNFLDNAKEGAIYFSMGSHIKSSNFSPDKKRIIINVFKKLKLKVLWKFEDEVLEGKPDNVLIKKWVPQVDILAHPNVKLFISHAGHGSILETIYHGVPTLMIPVFADQFANAIHAETQGYALKLSYKSEKFDEETLYAMIKEMLDNSRYTEKAKYISKLFHDRPMKPLDTAVYWLEYVMRYKGADHLKVAGVRLPWYKFYMVDVFTVLIVILSIIGYAICKILRIVLCKKGKSKKVKSS